MTGAERDGLADILQRTAARYDRLFDVSFPYSMGFHQRADRRRRRTQSGTCTLHFYPPLLRSATVRKFMVGYEMLGRRSAISRRRGGRAIAGDARRALPGRENGIEFLDSRTGFATPEVVLCSEMSDPASPENP